MRWEDHPGFEAADERRDAACNEEDDALEALTATAPTTVAGAAALASYSAASLAAVVLLAVGCGWKEGV